MPRARFISVNYSQNVLGMNRSLHQLRNRGFERQFLDILKLQLQKLFDTYSSEFRRIMMNLLTF